jgi:hypothetical protein
LPFRFRCIEYFDGFRCFSLPFRWPLRHYYAFARLFSPYLSLSLSISSPPPPRHISPSSFEALSRLSYRPPPLAAAFHHFFTISMSFSSPFSPYFAIILRHFACHAMLPYAMPPARRKDARTLRNAMPKARCADAWRAEAECQTPADEQDTRRPC